MRPGAPSPAVNGSKEIGLFVAVIGSLYLRPQYNKPLALVKDLFAPIAAILSRTRPLHPLRDRMAAILPLFPRSLLFPIRRAVQPCSLVSFVCVNVENQDEIFHVVYDFDDRVQIPGTRSYTPDSAVPAWRAIRDDKGRIVVAICHISDAGDAWERTHSPQYPERAASLAYRIGINYVIYGARIERKCPESEANRSVGKASFTGNTVIRRRLR
jgi:hypothetical protein